MHAMTRVVLEEVLLPGTAVAEPGALERAIRAVCRGTMLQVRVPLRLGTTAALEAQYDVRCGTARGIDESRLNDVVIVSWEPAARLALPALHAVVTSDLSEDGRTVVLRLDGSYDPPGRGAGAVFDAAVGKRIAEASARDFLRRVIAKLTGSTAATNGVS
jgi:hypothetical protein